MRDFFIRSLETVINVVMIIGIIIVVGAAIAVGVGGGIPGPNGVPQGGALAGFAVLIGGIVYLILVGGFIYLGLGIYNNTLRTANAVEKMQLRN